MPKEPSERKPLSGEVIMPGGGEGHMPIEAPLNGIPVFNRMRYRSVRRELEEYLKVLQTKNAVLREIVETARIGEEFNRALVRTERLDDLRFAEHRKIDKELDDAVEGEVQSLRNAQANAIAHRVRMATLEAQALEAERRLESVQNPPAPTPPPQPASERLAAEIAKIRQQEKDLIAALIGEFGSEDELPEEDRELIRDVRLATRNRIASLIDDLNR